MRKHEAILAIAVSITFAAAQTVASGLAPGSVNPKKTSEPAAQTKLVNATTAPASTPVSSPRGLAFQVNDDKGLLLTCIAPQLETNPDTDLFNSCVLAPGRTLDDVMHTFIRAIHFVQNEQLKERAEWSKEHEEKSVPKSGEK